ncbi:MAG: flavodoxin family protein [bacterium]
MKMIVYIGSRGVKGRTAQAGIALLEGFQEGGGSGEVFFLPHLNIERCRQCEDSGWGNCREGRCCVEDDFPKLLEKAKEAEILVFATPVYFGSLSESMRAFLDRLRRVSLHQEDGGISGKKVVGICVAGGGGGGAFDCSQELNRILLTCRLNVLDVIPARRQNFDLKLEILKLTGRWLATNHKEN